MKTTKRFENAVMKLYNAFHSNELKAMKCSACAVGNICDNTLSWSFRRNVIFNGNKFTSYVYEEEKDFKKNGYSISELVEIERIFLNENITIENKETQFKGLCAVVEYLAELDNIPNPMDYSKLFETNNDKPIYELNEVF